MLVQGVIGARTKSEVSNAAADRMLKRWGSWEAVAGALFPLVVRGGPSAEVLAPEAEYLLVGSILSPAWSPARARIGIDEAFVKRYAGTSAWATPEFLAFLAGPNPAHVAGGSEAALAVTAGVAAATLRQRRGDTIATHDVVDRISETPLNASVTEAIHLC